MPAEDALRESEEWLRLALDAAQMGTWDWDVRSGAIRWSRRLEEIHGLEPGAFDGTFDSFRRDIHPDDREHVLEAIRRTLEEGADYAVEYRIVRADGTVRWLEPKGRVMRDDDGRPVRMTGVCADVTDRKRAEQLSAGQNRVLELIATSAPLERVLSSLALLIESQCDGLLCSVLLLDEEGRRVRHGAAPSLPLSYVEAIDGAAVGPAAGSCGTAAFRGEPVVVTDILEDPLWVDYRHLAASHGLRACWSTPIASSQGRVLGTFAMYYREPRSPSQAEARLLDIAGHIAGIAIERARAEEALRESEERYRALFETAVSGNFISTPDGRLLACNRAFARMFGFASVEEALLADVRTLYANPGDRIAMMERLRRERELRDFEHVGVRRDGTVLHTVENVIGVFDAEGDLTQMTGFLLDHTERVHLEEQLRHAHKMEAVGRLAGGIAHDFNNLMTVIIGYARLLIRRAGPDASDLREHEEILNAATRATALTRQLLAFSRRQRLVPVVVDLNTIVLGIEQMLRRVIGEDVELEIRLDPDLHRVLADPGQVEQVIVNLAVNARDAMPGGGELTIATSSTVAGDALVRRYPFVRPGPYAELTVSDTGCGMDEETLSHIFEPFFTTKGVGKGTGLGLATVYGIVTQSGGYVLAESRPRAGAMFRVLLPPTSDSPAPDERGPTERGPTERGPTDSPAVESTPHGSETILLVEDEEGVRDLVTALLRLYGYGVLEAGNGAEALRVCEGHPGTIDLLVTDVVMPRMSGPELVARARATRPDLRVLYMSGYSGDVLPDGAEEAFLAKPFRPEELARKVRALLNASPA